MLKETPKATGGQPYQKKSTGTTAVPVEVVNPIPSTLADMGLDKKTSKVAQDVASLLEDDYEIWE